MAQTSKAHLNYLRVYAKNLEAPILSVRKREGRGKGGKKNIV